MTGNNGEKKRSRGEKGKTSGQGADTTVHASNPFRAGEFFGEPHKRNGNPRSRRDLFYFTVEYQAAPKERVSGYVSREAFNELAQRLGMPTLSTPESAPGT